MTFQDFQQTIAELAQIPMEDISESSSFRDDLAIDSLQMVNILVEIAGKYGWELTNINSSEDLQTVGNLYRTFLRGIQR